MTRDVAGILHFLTPQQMAEEIVRLDAVMAGGNQITMGRLPIVTTGCEWARGCAMDCCPEKKAYASGVLPSSSDQQEQP